MEGDPRDHERDVGTVHVESSEGSNEGNEGNEGNEVVWNYGVFAQGDEIVRQEQEEQGDEEHRGRGLWDAEEQEYHYVPQPYVRTRSISGASAGSVDSNSTTGSSGSGRWYATSSSRPAQSLNLDGVSPVRFFFAWPWKSIIYNNNTSEARDLDAAERNFQSLMRTALYLGLVGSVVLCNYRLPSTGPHKDKDSMGLDTKIAIPFGIVFIALSVLGLLSSFHNYILTVTSYAKQRAEVHTHWSTWIHLAGASMVIFAATIVFLVTAK